MGGLQQALAEHKQLIEHAQASAHAQLASIKVLWNVCRTASCIHFFVQHIKAQQTAGLYVKVMSSYHH